MWLLIGLGNPGTQYQETRHNIGFMAVDAIAHRHSFAPFSSKFSGQYAEKTIGQERIILFKPQSFMNLSGGPVGELCRFFKIAAEQVVVLHDELDVPLGRLRTKRGGGHGGHNGLKSLDSHIGQAYQRIRIGIGHPGDKDLVSDYVLSRFSSGEQALVSDVLYAISAESDALFTGDAESFTSRAMQRLVPPPVKEKKPRPPAQETLASTPADE